MAELKTQPNDADVGAFLAAVEPERRRRDAQRLLEIFVDVTGETPVMWGDSIVGFGSYDYRYASGREGRWLKVGFSPRKRNLTLYVMNGFDDHEDLLARLGRHTHATSCLYITRLENVDEAVLRELIAASYAAPAMGEVAD